MTEENTKNGWNKNTSNIQTQESQNLNKYKRLPKNKTDPDAEEYNIL